MKLMLLTAGASATVTFALVLIALSLGIEHRGVGGHVWLEAALWFNAPGALVFLAGCALVIAITGRLSEIPDLTSLVVAACISTVIYGFAGLWLGVILQRRRTRREMEGQSHANRAA